MSLTLGELFAGYGGLGLAVEEVLGARLAWYAEFDPSASKIMAHHWPDLTNYGDVTAVDWSQVPHVDIISGGSPCQDLSLAGARRGMTEGTRSNLWESMREAIATIQPTYVVWENVRGALSAKAASASDVEPGDRPMGEGSNDNLRALGRVLGDLADLGYDCEWHGLRASDVGAPHQRYRVFLLGTRRDAGDAALRAGDEERPARPGSDRERQGTHRGPDRALEDANLAACSERRIAAPRQEEGGRTWADAGRRGGTPTADTAGDAGRVQHRDGEPAAHSTGHGRDEGRTEPAGQQGGHDAPLGRDDHSDWGPYAPAIARWEAVRGTAPAPTELTAKGAHRLSARFTEWMMGLPPGWVTNVPINRNDQLKACGNGVVPQQAAHALRIMLGRSTRGGFFMPKETP